MMLSRREFIQISSAGLVAALSAPLPVAAQKTKGGKFMYVAKDYSKLIGMEGFSETLLKNHFTLYQGYVTNTNKLVDTLAQMLKEERPGPRNTPN